MPPAARATDMHVCLGGTGPIVPSGEITVLIDNLPAATVAWQTACTIDGADPIIMGSTGVFINHLPAARVGDPTLLGGKIVMGSLSCQIGETGTPPPGSAGFGGVVAGLLLGGVELIA